MRPRRAFIAALALPLLPREAAAFRLTPADAETEALVSARAAACAGGRLHEDLAADLAAAVARARDRGEAEAAVLAALGTCPFCGCGLATLAATLAPEAEPGPF